MPRELTRCSAIAMALGSMFDGGGFGGGGMDGGGGGGGDFAADVGITLHPVS